MKISNVSMSNLKGDAFVIYASKLFSDIVTALNNGLNIEDNISGKVATVVFTAANTEVKIEHNLNRIPTGYVLLGASAALSLYDGTTETTKTTIFLRSNAVGTARVLIL